MIIFLSKSYLFKNLSIFLKLLIPSAHNTLVFGSAFATDSPVSIPSAINTVFEFLLLVNSTKLFLTEVHR